MPNPQAIKTPHPLPSWMKKKLHASYAIMLAMEKGVMTRYKGRLPWATFCVLASYLPDVRPSRATLATRLGVEIKAVDNVLKRLRDDGYISWITVDGHNRYTIHELEGQPVWEAKQVKERKPHRSEVDDPVELEGPEIDRHPPSKKGVTTPPKRMGEAYQAQESKYKHGKAGVPVFCFLEPDADALHSDTVQQPSHHDEHAEQRSSVTHQSHAHVDCSRPDERSEPVNLSSTGICSSPCDVSPSFEQTTEASNSPVHGSPRANLLTGDNVQRHNDQPSTGLAQPGSTTPRSTTQSISLNHVQTLHAEPVDHASGLSPHHHAEEDVSTDSPESQTGTSFSHNIQPEPYPSPGSASSTTRPRSIDARPQSPLPDPHDSQPCSYSASKAMFTSPFTVTSDTESQLEQPDDMDVHWADYGLPSNQERFEPGRPDQLTPLLRGIFTAKGPRSQVTAAVTNTILQRIGLHPREPLHEAFFDILREGNLIQSTTRASALAHLMCYRGDTLDHLADWIRKAWRKARKPQAVGDLLFQIIAERDEITNADRFPLLYDALCAQLHEQEITPRGEWIDDGLPLIYRVFRQKCESPEECAWCFIDFALNSHGYVPGGKPDDGRPYSAVGKAATPGLKVAAMKQALDWMGLHSSGLQSAQAGNHCLSATTESW